MEDRLEEGPQPLGWIGVLLPVLREEFGELSPGRLHHSLAVVRGEPLVPKVLQQLAHDVHVVVPVTIQLQNI